jgi:tetratricopeptide (TPR) repeat protein
MAEGLIGGILGEEDEKPDVEATETLAGADAFAAAVAAKLAGNDPGVARKTEIFLDKQAALLEIQAEHLKDEHAARLHYLQGQASEVDLRRFGLRLRVAFQLFVALVAAGVGIGLVVMVRDAVTSRSVVIDSFDAPPALAASGLSGKVVAAGLLDVLTKIQAATRTSADRRSLSNAWTNEISLELPETGVSLGQLERLIKTRFGHDQHIDGDLVQTEKGVLALTVRGTGILPKTFTEESRDLEKLLTEAGEYVYGQSQPGLWTNYLTNTGRNDDSIHFAKSSYGAVEASEKPYVLYYWAEAIVSKGGPGAYEEALPLWQEAVRLKPDFWMGYNAIMWGVVSIGHEEELIRVVEQMTKTAGGRPGKAPENMYQNYDILDWDLPAVHASNLADLESHSGIGTQSLMSGAEGLQLAQFEVQMHDLEAAALRLKTTQVDEKVAADVATAAFVRAIFAEEQGDLPKAAKEWDLFAVAGADPGFFAQGAWYFCYSAVTYQKTGQPQKADTALNIVGALTFVDCYRFRGDVLDLRGDWSGAEEWYAKAVKLAPSLPAGYYSWGLALAKHGDFARAAAKLEVANKKGPHWADPLKAWGDVLVKQGNTKDALAKYDEALKYAPNWQQLKEAKEALAKQKT